MDEKINKITDSLDRELLETLPVERAKGGVQIDNYNQLLDLAKTMSTAKGAIPMHLRGSPGDCLAIWDLALNVGLSPYMLAQHCYLVNGLLAYDAQVIHGIIAKHAPIEQRLRYTYQGEGDKRRCTVSGQFIGEATPCEYTTPEIGKINPKNSPLWVTDPDQQLAYFAVKRWGRRYCPDILMGVYDQDEVQEFIGPDNAKDVSPQLLDRLPGRVEGEGFRPDATQEAEAEHAALSRAEQIRATRKGKRGPKRGRRMAARGPRKRQNQPEAPKDAPEPETHQQAVKAAKLPSTMAEYIEYVRTVLPFMKDPVGWYISDEQELLRQECGVSEQTYKLLKTVAQEQVK